MHQAPVASDLDRIAAARFQAGRLAAMLQVGARKHKMRAAARWNHWPDSVGGIVSERA